MIFLSPYCRAHRHVMFLCSLVKIHLKCFSMCSYIDLMKFIISAKGYCLWGCYQQVSRLIKYSCFMSPDESRQCPWLPESSVTDLKIQFTGHCPQTKLQLDLCCTNPPSTILRYYSLCMQRKKKKVFHCNTQEAFIYCFWPKYEQLSCYSLVTPGAFQPPTEQSNSTVDVHVSLHRISKCGVPKINNLMNTNLKIKDLHMLMWPLEWRFQLSFPKRSLKKKGKILVFRMGWMKIGCKKTQRMV